MRRVRWLGTALLVVMVGVLVAYAVVHSPLRNLVQSIVGDLPGCRPPCDLDGLTDLAGAASALWLITMAALASWALVERSPLAEMEHLVAWGALASALITVPAAVVGGMGNLTAIALLRPPLGPMIASIPAAVAVAWAWRAGWRPRRPTVALPAASPLLVLVGGLVVILLVLSIGIAIRRPPTGFDELGYHAPLAALFYREGAIGGFQAAFDDTVPLWHPGSSELWLGLLRLIGGEPLAIVGQLPYALLGAAGVVLFGRRLGLGRKAGLLAGLLFLLAPIVVIQSARMSSDLVGAAFVIAAGALVAAPAREWSVARIALLGLLLGVIAVTKIALLPLMAALALAVVWTIWRARRSDGLRDRLVPAVAAGGLLFLLAVGPWWLRNVVAQGNPIYPAALPFLGRGVEQQSLGPMMDAIQVPARLLWPFYPVFEAHDNNSGLGAAFAVLIVPGLVGAAAVARRRPLGILVVMTIVTLPIWWLLTRHEPRFLLGLAGLAFALLPFGVIAVGRRWRQAATWVVGLACVLSAAVTVASALSFEAGRPVGRDAFYAQVWDVNPAALALPEEQGLLLDDDCPGGLTRLYPLLGPSQDRHVVRIGCDATPAEVQATMRRNRLRYAYAAGSPAVAAGWDQRFPADSFELIERNIPSRAGAEGQESRLYRLLGD